MQLPLRPNLEDKYALLKEQGPGMLTQKTSVTFELKVLFAIAVLAGSLQAQVEPDRSGVGQAEFRLNELNIENDYLLPNALPVQAASQAAADLASFGLPANSGRIDTRGGRWATLMLAEPLLPGQGVGNGLSWANLGRGAPKNDAEIAQAAAQAFRGFVQANSQLLQIDIFELADPGKVTVNQDGTSIQIYVPRVFAGVPVRGSYLTATINHGNLILFGTNNWGDINVSTAPRIPEDAAQAVAQNHVEPFPVSGSWGKSELVLVPIARGQGLSGVSVGLGYDHRLAWVIRPAFDGDLRHYEALVDAQTGQVLSFEDTNQYVATERKVVGGVYPVSNDGVPPDGVEQAAWPMPFDIVQTPVGPVTTDAGGNLPAPVEGNITSSLSGQFVNINDNCGAISLTSAGDIDFGSSGGTDCSTPGFGGAGNTHASRTGFYELNRIIEMGQGQLPANAWLQQQLTSNMNLNQTCNAFWRPADGTVNFFRSGGGCNNTGEIAGVFDHEWGHGLDDNDAVPTIAGPSGEGIADIYAALRLNTSCIGRNFRATVCGGFGDPCLTCTGVRDIDYLQRQSGQPHDYSWSNANCGGSVHCIGGVYSEAVWSLWKRELQGPPYSMDDNTSHELVTRLTYIGAGATGTWFSGGPPNGGCAGSSGYMNYLAADDDNGNLNDGTPHMTAIFNAFNDQEIACGSPTVQDSGCVGTPTVAPVVTGNPLDKSVSLSWGAVTGATSYEVFRTDGVFACDFGKVRIGETAGTSFNDSGLQNGRSYSYVVIPKGSAAACFGPASSCTTVTPVAGPNLDVDPASGVLTINTGDGDSFIDNCEDATMVFDVDNTGVGDLTNVRITGVTAVSHPTTTITTTFPAAVSPPDLAQGTTGTGSFDFTAGDLAFGDTMVFEVSVTSDEIFPVVKTRTLTIADAESDLQFVASQTWDFETDLDGWTLVQGTFNQTSPGGANGSSGYVASSAFLDNQCDQVRSPAFRLTTFSTLSVETNFDIENFAGQWWDRANLAFVENGNRNSVDPDGGRPYNASGGGASCVTVGQNGWAASMPTWDPSSWSATALDSAGRAGSSVQLDVAYGTDISVVGSGFWFDQVTLTDIELLVADAQPDFCGPVNQPPTVTIGAPTDGSSFAEGTSIDFTGTAIDPEDGDISASIEWSSDRDGPVGMGGTVTTTSLSVNTHTITATATDSGNPTATPETGMDQITVTINPTTTSTTSTTTSTTTTSTTTTTPTTTTSTTTSTTTTTPTTTSSTTSTTTTTTSSTTTTLLEPPGTLKWTFETGDFVDSAPALNQGGVVYAASEDGGLYALNPDGTLRWVFLTGGPVSSSPAIDMDGTIYVGSEDGNVYAVHPDGTMKWAFATGSLVFSSPAIGSDGTIYVGSYDTNLYAINPDGTMKWAFPTASFLFSSPAIDTDGTIYIGSFGGVLYAVNFDGTLKWTVQTGARISSSAVIGANGTIYVGSQDNNLYAIDPDGQTQWVFPIADRIFSSPAVGADGTVYVGSRDNNLYAINSDGTAKWVFPTQGTIISSLTIGPSGTLYVGSRDNSIYAVNGDSGGPANSPWPMFHYDATHTGQQP